MFILGYLLNKLDKRPDKGYVNNNVATEGYYLIQKGISQGWSNQEVRDVSESINDYVDRRGNTNFKENYYEVLLPALKKGAPAKVIEDGLNS